ncbi:ABC transporter ATP-binding protein [Ferrovibrio terrae]|uniref:ABC transporter ATP-binding protein n=1 Tax=Ferrovibrio terrae TaxID=2594003 RepID=A0A516GYE7_9PROT|nr:ABC transporter ATP-binding protein [Ferrovibrio terrae]QDO96360.1 ABC transporter ATP-binding protein [Ferrovibrio terrae]
MTIDAITPVSVTVDHVSLSYGENAVLKDVSLKVQPGEFFAFLGPSGCGKTTLLRLIAGFAHAQGGRILIGDREVTDLRPWQRDVGLVFQNYALWPHMTVAENVAFGLEERRLASAEIKKRVGEMLELVGLSALGDRRPSQLSGGQQQRVALARTLAVRPRVLLLDEPLSNLDAKMRVQVRRELRDLQRSLGITAIFVTHDQEEANTVCDRIAVMNAGVVQQVAAPMELFARPANLFVANFLGTANVLAGHVDGGFYRLTDGQALPVPAGTPSNAQLVLRPQGILLASDQSRSVEGRVRLSGRVTDREFLGSSMRYCVATITGELQVDVSGVDMETPREIGDAVDLDLMPQHAIYLTEC